MFILKWILISIISLAALVAILFLIGTLYGWEKIWARSVGPADLGPVTFEGLKKSRKPNQALVCPNGLCAENQRDFAAPVYNLSVTDLRKEFISSLEAEAELERVDDKQDDTQARFIQRTKLLRFPDTIRVKFIPVGENRSTLALYSQSQIGESDLGVNKKRLRRWLARLEHLAVSE